jgi:DNA repair protein RadC
MKKRIGDKRIVSCQSGQVLVTRKRKEAHERRNNFMVLLRHSTITIDQATDAVAVFQGLFTHEDQIDRDKEHFYVCHLDSRRHIMLVELVAIGILNHVAIHPRETFRRAVSEGTDSLIIAHNHPSGDVSPSENDITVTTPN